MDDWTTLVKNAVAVLVILLASSVVLFLAYLGLNAANKGGEKLSNTTSALDERSFDSYNQTTISGTTVLSAIRNFQNQPVAVLVRTKRSGDKVMNYDAYLGAASGATTPAWEHTKSDVSAPTGVTGMPSKLTTSQVLYAEQQNLDTTKSTKKSENHYINPNAKFKSVLVYDSNDEVVGIYIEQNGVTDPVLKDS